MPRVCSICTHDQRQAIDRALLAGDPYRYIASRFDTSTAALQRHKSEHLKARIAKVAERQEEADLRTAIDVRGQLKAINGVALGILKEARDTGDGALALQAIDRIQKQIELQARLIDLLRDGDTVNFVINPQWIEIRSLLLTALQAHPEARLAVAEALQGIEGGDRRAVA